MLFRSSADRDVWATVEPLVRETVERIGALYGARTEVEYIQGVPPVVNDDECADLAAKAVESVLGTDGVGTADQSAAARTSPGTPRRSPASTCGWGCGTASPRRRISTTRASCWTSGRWPTVPASSTRSPASTAPPELAGRLPASGAHPPAFGRSLSRRARSPSRRAEDFAGIARERVCETLCSARCGETGPVSAR